MKLFKNKKGSELVEKIIVTAFSVAMAAAVILWMVNVINISKTVNLNGGIGGGSGTGAGALKVQGKTKIGLQMTSSQEKALMNAIKEKQDSEGLDSQNAAKALVKELNHNSPGYVPQMMEEYRDVMYFGSASFSSIPSGEEIATAMGGDGSVSLTYKGCGYVDMTAGTMYELPVSAGLIFIMGCLNEDNLTPECKAAANACTGTQEECEQALIENYVFGGASMVMPLSGNGNLTYSLNIPGFNPERTSGMTSDSQGVSFGEANFAYLCYEYQGQELIFPYDANEGRLCDMSLSPLPFEISLNSITPVSSPYFSTTLLD